MTVRQIGYGSQEYKEALELRNKILRIPLGLDLFDEDLSGEINDIHIGAFLNGVLIGVLVLTRINGVKVKMRQLAVDETYQRQRVGASMVEHAERLSFIIGYSEIYLHARVTAVKFYERLRYLTEGEEFIEIGIPHIAMAKKLISKNI